MVPSAIDHLVLTAPTLASGAEFVTRALGVPLQRGGEHPRMGTHNLLLRLSASTYLEVIAVDPAAAGPGRPRWFGLDGLAPNAAPRLATWVARTATIEAAAAGVPEPLGVVEAMTRGDLRWRLTVPPDGTMPLDGLAPALIQWESPGHPAETLVDRGCVLEGLEARHPDPARLRAVLKALGLGGEVQVTAGAVPALAARIRTPSGVRWIGPA